MVGGCGRRKFVGRNRSFLPSIFFPYPGRRFDVLFRLLEDLLCPFLFLNQHSIKGAQMRKSLDRWRLAAARNQCRSKHMEKQTRALRARKRAREREKFWRLKGETKGLGRMLMNTKSTPEAKVASALDGTLTDCRPSIHPKCPATSSALAWHPHTHLHPLSTTSLSASLPASPRPHTPCVRHRYC